MKQLAPFFARARAGIKSWGQVPGRISRRLQDFLAWWGAGLLYFLPASVQGVFRTAAHRLAVEVQPSAYVIRRIDGRSGETLEERRFPLGEDAARADCRAWLRTLEQGDPAPVAVLLPEERVLTKSLLLPAAAGRNLRDVMQFEIDRQTPFSADQVYYDCQVVDERRDDGKIRVKLFITRRDYLDELMDALGDYGAAPTGAGVASQEAGDAAPDLLFGRQRPAKKPSGRTTGVLAAVAAALFLCLLYLPLLRYDLLLRQWEDKVQQERAQARELQADIEAKERAAARSLFLWDRRTKQLPAVEVLKELTLILPDDTWLNRLVVSNGELRLEGESGTATSLIQLLESSIYFQEAQFRSPVTRNNVTQKDRFQVSAGLTEKEKI